jgi:cell division septal protein FtsQ
MKALSTEMPPRPRETELGAIVQQSGRSPILKKEGRMKKRKKNTTRVVFTVLTVLLLLSMILGVVIMALPPAY